MCFFCRCWVVSQPAEEHSDAASVRPWHQRVHSEAGTETHASSGQTGPGSLQEHQWLVCGYAGCCWDSQSQQPDGADTGRSVVRLRHCLTYTDKLKKTVATWTKDKLRSLCLPEYYCHTFVLWLKTLCRDWDLFYAEALNDLIVTRTQRIVLWIIFWYCFLFFMYSTFLCVCLSRLQPADWCLCDLPEASVLSDSTRPQRLYWHQQASMWRLHLWSLPHRPLLYDGREAYSATGLKQVSHQWYFEGFSPSGSSLNYIHSSGFFFSHQSWYTNKSIQTKF